MGGGKSKSAGTQAADTTEHYAQQNAAAQKQYDQQRQAALLAALSGSMPKPQFNAAGANPGVFGASTAQSVNPAGPSQGTQNKMGTSPVPAAPQPPKGPTP
jgi:hypothetical protein